MLAALLAHPDLRDALLATLVGDGAVREALSLLDLSRTTTHADGSELARLVAAWVAAAAADSGAAVQRLADHLHARAITVHAALLDGDLEHAARSLAFLSAQQRTVVELQAARGRLLLDLHTALGGAERQLLARARRLQGDGGALATSTAAGARRHACAASSASSADSASSASSRGAAHGASTTTISRVGTTSTSRGSGAGTRSTSRGSGAGDGSIA